MIELAVLANRVLPSRLRSAVGQGTFGRGVAILAGGTAMGQIIAAAGSPILSRLYTPGEMGAFGIYVTFVLFAQTGSSLMYDWAIVAADDDHEAAVLAAVAGVLAVPTCIIATAGLFLLVTSDSLGYGRLPIGVVPLATVSLLVTATFTTLRYWFIRDGGFAVISSALVIQNGGRTAIQIGTGAAGAGWWGLGVGDVCGRALGVGRKLTFALPVIRDELHGVNLSDVRRTMRKFRRFPLYSLPSSLINTLALNLPLPLLVATFGFQAGGYYGLVLAVVGAPLAVVGGSVGDAFYHRIGGIARTDPAAARPLLVRTAASLLAAGALPALLLAIAGPALFATIFGERWRTAGAIAARMAPLFLAQLCVTPVSRTVLIFRGQRAKLLYDVATLVATLATFAFASARSYSLLMTVSLLAASNVAAYILYFFILVRRGVPKRSPRGFGLTGAD